MDHVRVGGGASNETLGAKQMDTVQLIGGFGVAIANCMHGRPGWVATTPSSSSSSSSSSPNQSTAINSK